MPIIKDIQERYRDNYIKKVGGTIKNEYEKILREKEKRWREKKLDV